MTMFKSKNKVSRKDAEKLLDAYLEYKNAEAKFKQLKDELLKEVDEGIYEFDGLCKISKTSFLRTTIDGRKILDENPKLDEKRYSKTSVGITVTITNLR